MTDTDDTNASQPQGKLKFKFHGAGLRGINHLPQSPSFEGRFGRMFRTLPPALFDVGDLEKLALCMVAKPKDPMPTEEQVDPEENQGIDAGYTYLGQFIDHDLTFDPASSLQKQNDPDGLMNFRTPRFDLDSIYGRGPDDQPYLYADDPDDLENIGVKMLLGRTLNGNVHDLENKPTRDVPRNFPDTPPRRALIGDPRNDENVIVAQLHAMMLRFHNRIFDFLKTRDGRAPLFTEIQRLVRWHYQWVVLHDFLPTIVGTDMVHSILPHLAVETSITETPPKLLFYHWRELPFVPIEFSAAAYRFGHSMVRPIYRLNTTLNDASASGSRQVILSTDPDKSLTGFRAFPNTWAIDWSLFFDMGNNPPRTGIDRLQRSYKIDTSLVDPLGHLPPSIGGAMPSLAFRNLLRGMRMSLPSGQSVARFMGEPVIPDEKLKVGKATADSSADNPTLVSISPKFADNAPLWYYILAEAQQAFNGNDETTIRLGPVGGRIVAEVFIGLLLGDKFSFLSQDPNWKPFQEFTNNGLFRMADLIKQAMKA